MTAIEIDVYDQQRDWDSVYRIWHEIGWLSDSDTEKNRKFLQTELDVGPTRVARLEGVTESMAIGADAQLHYLDAELPLAAVTAVTTSRIARKRGLAGRVTARLVADMAENGAAVSMLGMFDQGYYDRLGFGSGGYNHRIALQPQDLKVPPASRMPLRLTPENSEEMHACRLRRIKRHGNVSFPATTATFCETARDDRFGFGFRDEASGDLTHYVWCRSNDLGVGPYHILSIVYENQAQFLELLGAFKSLEDQVQLVTLFEPPEIQMQDLIARPFYRRGTSRQAKFATGIESYAEWQARICNLPACIAKTRLNCEPLRFNLDLSDPITESLASDHSWQGIAGQYIVTLGPESQLESGSKADLPTLTATVGALTRLWLGVRPASGLAVTDRLQAPAKLLAKLDAAFRLPTPNWDWRF